MGKNQKPWKIENSEPGSDLGRTIGLHNEN